MTALEVPACLTDVAARLPSQDDLDLPLCVTCSTQTSHTTGILDFSVTDTPYKCKICLDPRQFIGFTGQRWTSLRELGRSQKYKNSIETLIDGCVWTIRTEPSFGIGQRAFLIKDGQGKVVMWDCIAYLDNDTLSFINDLSEGKGLTALCLSHPHYFSTTTIWAAVFPQAKFFLAKADFDEWYQRRDVVEAYERHSTSGEGRERTALQAASQIQLVSTEMTELWPESDFKLLLLGGHFPGSLVLLWKENLFIADTVQVVASGRYNSHERQRDGVVSVTFLWSYPNLIPLSAEEVIKVCKPLEKVEFSRAFGAFADFNIWGHAKEKILQSRDIIVNRLVQP